MSYSFTNDQETTERMSEQRDAIYDYVVGQFRVHMANDDIDSAMALADEFYEWMDPDQLENEPTMFYNEDELLRRYLELSAE
jgi:hypothetical protein|tara:strand:- start:4153 stop:4398 length:246 start_codon:yes stop_codon:yes gene_type:complete